MEQLDYIQVLIWLLLDTSCILFFFKVCKIAYKNSEEKW